MDPDALGWLGLNRAVNQGDGVLVINPVVGMRSQPVERLVAELTDEKLHPYLPPTVTRHLGYLMPEVSYVPWLFARLPDAAVIAGRMARAVKEHGLPFMSRNADLAALVETMASSKHGIPDQTAYRLPVGCFLLGRYDAAEEHLRRWQSHLGSRQDPAAGGYRSFAAAFEARLAAARAAS